MRVRYASTRPYATAVPRTTHMLCAYALPIQKPTLRQYKSQRHGSTKANATNSTWRRSSALSTRHSLSASGSDSIRWYKSTQHRAEGVGDTRAGVGASAEYGRRR
eukprot:3938106-Rhodomonas_salina.8